MRNEKILHKNGIYLYTESGPKIAIGNANHQIGDFIHTTGNVAFGNRRFGGVPPIVKVNQGYGFWLIISKRDEDSYDEVYRKKYLVTTKNNKIDLRKEENLLATDDMWQQEYYLIKTSEKQDIAKVTLETGYLWFAYRMKFYGSVTDEFLTEEKIYDNSNGSKTIIKTLLAIHPTEESYIIAIYEREKTINLYPHDDYEIINKDYISFNKTKYKVGTTTTARKSYQTTIEISCDTHCTEILKKLYGENLKIYENKYIICKFYSFYIKIDIYVNVYISIDCKNFVFAGNYYASSFEAFEEYSEAEKSIFIMEIFQNEISHGIQPQAYSTQKSLDIEYLVLFLLIGEMFHYINKNEFIYHQGNNNCLTLYKSNNNTLEKIDEKIFDNEISFKTLWSLPIKL